MPAYQDLIEKIKDDLMVHAAKTIIEGSISSPERVFGTVLGVSTVALPAYTAILAFIVREAQGISLILISIPILFWITSLIICVVQIFPRHTFYDLKDVPGIIQNHTNTLKRARRWGRISIVFLVLGVLSAALIIFYVGGLLVDVAEKSA